MSTTAADVMQSDVVCVDADVGLDELEAVLLREEVHGVPVLDAGRVVGIVSRSDLVRQLQVERERFAAASTFYLDPWDAEERTEQDHSRSWEAAGARLGKLKVRDVMTREVLSVAPDAPLADVARTLLERRVHRLLVMRDGALCGIISTTDLIRLLAESDG